MIGVISCSMNDMQTMEARVDTPSNLALVAAAIAVIVLCAACVVASVRWLPDVQASAPVASQGAHATNRSPAQDRPAACRGCRVIPVLLKP